MQVLLSMTAIRCAHYMLHAPVLLCTDYAVLVCAVNELQELAVSAPCIWCTASSFHCNRHALLE
jgi:hypothetical protein